MKRHWNKDEMYPVITRDRRAYAFPERLQVCPESQQKGLKWGLAGKWAEADCLGGKLPGASHGNVLKGTTAGSALQGTGTLVDHLLHWVGQTQ